MILSYKGFSLKDDYLKPYIDKIVKDLRLDTKRPLNIEVIYKNLYDRNYFGYCEDIGSVHKDFRLVLNSDCDRSSLPERVASIAHEFRHIWQKVNGDESRAIRLNTDNYGTEEFKAYYNQPSEKDARKYERTIVKKLFSRRSKC